MASKMVNLERVLARLAKIPKAVQDAAEAQLRKEVDGLVAAQKAAAPDDPKTGGSVIRDSIHAYPNPDRPLSYRIINDAKDEDGKFIAGNVEYGHRARDGSHVPATPSFWPIYRARKKGMKRRMAAVSRKKINEIFPKG